MAVTESLKNYTYISGSAISQFRFVTLATDGQVDHTGAGLRAQGVALDAATGAGKAIPVAYDGRVTVTAGGTVTLGANAASNATGQAVVGTTGNVILGTFLEAGVSGQLVQVELRRDGTLAP